MSITTIQIDSRTRDRIKQYGFKSETYDTILNRVLDYFETRDEKFRLGVADRFVGGKRNSG